MSFRHGDVAEPMVTGEETAKRGTLVQFKPDPEVFLKACALAGGDPAASFVFEDSFSGIQAGLAGGFIVMLSTVSKEIHEYFPPTPKTSRTVPRRSSAS